MGKLAFFFVQGLAVGSGPCFLSCAPLVLPFLAGTKGDWGAGLRAVLIFGLARVVIYTLLSGVVGYIGAYLFQLFYSQSWSNVVWSIAALFIIISGTLMLGGRRFNNPFCAYLQRETLDNKAGSLVMLGVIVALAPCLPLLAVLTEIMFLAEKFYQGWLYGLAFGLGTLISPLLLLGVIVPKLPVRPSVLNAVCGFLLIAAGLYLLVFRIKM